jgi:hypothetical protein
MIVLGMGDDDPFIARVVGRRKQPPAGQVPPMATRDAFAAMANYRTCAPKGVYRYASHAEANRDRERWQLEALSAGAIHNDG